MVSLFALITVTALLHLAVAQYHYTRLSIRAGHARWEALYKDRLILDSLPLIRAEGSPGSRDWMVGEEPLHYRWQREGSPGMRADRIVAQFDEVSQHWPRMTGLWVETDHVHIFVRDLRRVK